MTIKIYDIQPEEYYEKEQRTDILLAMYNNELDKIDDELSNNGFVSKII